MCCHCQGMCCWGSCHQWNPDPGWACCRGRARGCPCRCWWGCCSRHRHSSLPPSQRHPAPPCAPWWQSPVSTWSHPCSQTQGWGRAAAHGGGGWEEGSVSSEGLLCKHAIRLMLISWPHCLTSQNQTPTAAMQHAAHTHTDICQETKASCACYHQMCWAPGGAQAAPRKCCYAVHPNAWKPQAQPKQLRASSVGAG